MNDNLLPLHIAAIALAIFHPAIFGWLLVIWFAWCIIAGFAKEFAGPVSKLGRMLSGAVRGWQESVDGREGAK